MRRVTEVVYIPLFKGFFLVTSYYYMVSTNSFLSLSNARNATTEYCPRV